MSNGNERYRPKDSGQTPGFARPGSFMRLPQLSDPANLDIALVGVAINFLTDSVIRTSALRSGSGRSHQ
jgi:hypothetical protein